MKNVSGYDLCRLLGRARSARWRSSARSSCAPGLARRLAQWFGAARASILSRCSARLYRPASILWDGTTTWVLLEGHPADVAAQAALVPGLVEVEGPPAAADRRPPVAARRRAARPAAGSDGGVRGRGGRGRSSTATNPTAPRPLDPGGRRAPRPDQGRLRSRPAASTPAASTLATRGRRLDPRPTLPGAPVAGGRGGPVP